MKKFVLQSFSALLLANITGCAIDGGGVELDAVPGPYYYGDYDYYDYGPVYEPIGDIFVGGGYGYGYHGGWNGGGYHDGGWGGGYHGGGWGGGYGGGGHR